MAREFSGRQPILNAPPGTVGLIGLLVVISVLLHLLGPVALDWVLVHFALVPALFFERAIPGAPDFTPLGFVPLFSYIFLHLDWMHLVLNCAVLLAFGSLIERQLGIWRFLAFFVACGVGGGIVQLAFVGPQMSVVLGASGGIYGAIGGAVPIMFAGAVGAQRRRGLVFIAVIMGINLLFGLFDFGLVADGATIAWQDHLGGFFTGLALMAWLRRPPRRRPGPRLVR